MVRPWNSGETLILQSVALRDAKKDRPHDHGADRNDETESRQFADVAVVPQFPNFYRHDLRSWRVEQEGDGEFPEGDEKDINPAGEESGHDQRNDNVTDHLKPTGAAGHGPFFEFPVEA